MSILPVLVLVVAMQDPAVAQDDTRQTSRFQRQEFNQTVTVPKGTRVDLRDCIGDVVVKTWNREAVQVRASGSRRTSATDIKAVLADKVLTITQGTAPSQRDTDMLTVDFELLVPAWVELQIEGRECGVEVDGVAGNITVKNSDGDISLRGVGGTVEASSIDGSIEINGGKGRIRASSSDGDVTITNASGDIQAESIDGDVILQDVQPLSVDVSTVDGDVMFSGPFQATSKYRFSSHDGDIMLNIPENSSATFTIRRFQGELHTTLPLKATGDVRSGRRVTYTLGGGVTQVEIETFDGDVYIRKPDGK